MTRRPPLPTGIGRVHDTPNVFVADASLHVNNGGFNPALTIMALGYWVGGHIASRVAKRKSVHVTPTMIRSHLKNTKTHPSMRSPALRAVEDSTRRGSLIQDEQWLFTLSNPVPLQRNGTVEGRGISIFEKASSPTSTQTRQ